MAKKTFSFILVFVLFLYLLSGCDDNSTDEYNQSLHEFKKLTLKSGLKAEGVCNMIEAIWTDTIYGNLNADTAEYTHSNGVVHDSFNTSLALFFVSESYKADKELIESGLSEVDKMYLSLAGPPKGCEEGYKIATTLYEQYEIVIGLAANPSGSLNSYSDAFSDADTEYANAYKKLDRYFEAVEFTPKAD